MKKSKDKATDSMTDKAANQASDQVKDEEIQAVETIMATERIAGAGVWRLIAMIALGATVYNSAATRFNPYYIGFGILLCLLFGWIYKHFLRTFLTLFNPAIKKGVGKKSLHHAVDNSMLFLIPFAVMSLLATYYLKWTLTTAFLSTGIMSVGTAAAMEVGKMRDKPAIRNVIIASGVSFLFSFTLTMTVQLLSKAPGFVEGAVQFLLGLYGKGGGLS